MGLGVALNNALSGMKTAQKAVDLVSLNVANAGTPGYHKQSLSVLDYGASTSSYGAKTGIVSRAFSDSLQNQYTRSLSDAASASARATALDRLQGFLGKPGSTGSLDADYNAFRTALQELTASPEDAATRSEVLTSAQALVSNLNRMTTNIQGLRQDAEKQIGADVEALNSMLTTLEKVNSKIVENVAGGESRNSLLDQRDRLVSQISELVDTRVDYRADGTVAISTRSGVGLLDGKASQLSFTSAGKLNPGSLYNADPDKTGVGTLTIFTAAGLKIDAVRDNVFQSGEIAGLLEMRDKTLVTAQSQMDDVAASIALAMSTNETQGTAATSGAAAGFQVDISDMQAGNELRLDYKLNGVDKSVRIVRVDDASKLPMDFNDSTGTRVIGLSFSGGAASVATALQTALGTGFGVSATGSTLRILDDGATNTTDVSALVANSTSGALQGDGTGLSLFIDSDLSAFTNSMDGTPQKLGFAGRITLNNDIISDSRLLVQEDVGDPLGDAGRAKALLSRLDTLTFTSTKAGSPAGTKAFLSGSAGDIVAGAISYQGSVAEQAIGASESQSLTLETLDTRIQEQSGVDINEEMAKLLDLQNAYAANARVISIVQELLKSLMAI
jgi:flagellar hook-associated protein 1